MITMLNKWIESNIQWLLIGAIALGVILGATKGINHMIDSTLSKHTEIKERISKYACDDIQLAKVQKEMNVCPYLKDICYDGIRKAHCTKVILND